MNADSVDRPTDDELEAMTRSARIAVLEHSRQGHRRRLPLWIGVGFAAAALFGGGMSVGSAVASVPPAAHHANAADVHIACVRTPQSDAPFVYLSVNAAQTIGAAAACGRAWELSQALSNERAAALYLEKKYESGLCHKAGALSCLPTPPPSPDADSAVAPRWAPCSARQGYLIEVGYRTGDARAACAAQALDMR